MLDKADTSYTEGHYYEVGQADSISNKIEITSDWQLKAGDKLILYVRGEYNESAT